MVTHTAESTTARLNDVQRVLAGDEAMIAVGLRIAKSFGRNHPSLYEEFVSAAQYGLCLAALRTTHDGLSDSFRSFACDYMYTQCLKAIQDERPKGRRRSKNRVFRVDIDTIAEPSSLATDNSRKFDEIIEPLTDEERRLMKLVYQDSYTQVDVAKLLTCSEKKVWQVHDTALAKLRGDHGRRIAAGRVIMDTRLAANLSRDRLAKRIGKSLSYIKKIETGQLVPLEVDARRISEIIGVGRDK